MGSIRRAVGLMSGTSIDGIDAALVETDGEGIVRPLRFASTPYDDAMRERLRGAIAVALAMDGPAPHAHIDAVARDLTLAHADAVRALLGGETADVIGFHGQTIAHRPDRGWTWQIGDGALLSESCGTTVVADLRSADVAAGGQGAPLAPVYHRALAAGGAGEAVAILNLGGVGNLTWIGGDGDMVAFDTGPANALIDDWMLERTGTACDVDGATAATGRVDESVLTAMLDLPWFDAPPPKSLDRNDFSLAAARGLSVADGAATLTAFTAETVRLGLAHMPAPPSRLLVTGGGRMNPTLMAMLGGRTGLAVAPVEAAGWNGDAIEAQAFAYMAVRVLEGLPTSFPGTTGVPRPTYGGQVFWA